MTRFTLIALLATTLCGCHSTPARVSNSQGKSKTPEITGQQLSEIFVDRRNKGAMIGFRDASSSHMVEFATPDPPITGSVYRYETYLIRKKDLDPMMKARLEQVAIRPGGQESPPSTASPRGPSESRE